MRASKAQKISEPQMNLFPQLLPGRVQDGAELEVTGLVEQVLYSGAARGRMEVMARLDDGGLLAKVVGLGDPLSPGDQITAKGRWVPDPKHGRRFEADIITTRFPDTTAGIIRYLGAGAIKGVGITAAQKLAGVFGDKLPDVMTRPTELIAAGLPEEKAQAIATHWQLRTRHGRILSVLYSHNIGEATAQKIIRKYGDRAPTIVASHPYQLADDIRGIGFKKADAIALNQGLPKDSPERIRAGLKAAADAAGRDGDTCQPRNRLIVQAADLLMLNEREIRAEEESMLRAGILAVETIGGREVIYDAGVLQCEEWIADDIFSRIAPLAVPADVDRLIEACARTIHHDRPDFKGLDPHQHQAVKIALSNRISIITGGPGTGKTSTLRTVLACLTAIDESLRFTLSAPTGAAAQRITESTGHIATTTHVALGARGDGFYFGKDNQLKTNVFVIDESSMIDLWMMRSILEALPKDVRIILVGDANQLPSVGIGNVLCDLIDSGAIPVARLAKVHRQGAGSEIALAAEAINAGRMPKILKPNRNTDNWTVLVDSPQTAVNKLISLVTNVLPDLGFDPVADFQALTPGHQHETGTINLNRILQATLNPEDITKPEIHFKGRIFRTGDKVVHTVNDADRGVFNGNIGRIVHAAPGLRPQLTVLYRDHEVTYDRTEMDALQAAQATSVHKFQGSETKVASVVLSSQHHILLKRNLYYTGLTRARLLCCTIGQHRALRRAVMTEGSRRLTGLAQRLAGRSFTARRDAPIAL